MSERDDRLVACESVVAITVHLRRVGPEGVRYNGGPPLPTLCGSDAAWDLKGDPFAHVRCRVCREKLAEMAGAERG